LLVSTLTEAPILSEHTKPEYLLSVSNLKDSRGVPTIASPVTVLSRVLSRFQSIFLRSSCPPGMMGTYSFGRSPCRVLLKTINQTLFSSYREYTTWASILQVIFFIQIQFLYNVSGVSILCYNVHEI